jgi:hypothetical protein
LLDESQSEEQIAMAEILPSASYVRTPGGQRNRPHQAVLSSIDELSSEDTQRMWELLETPQTVDTLCRSLGNKSEESIRLALASLYGEDLIQVSPDT